MECWILAKIKVYELAKELNVESKEIIKRLAKMGVEVKSHMNAIDEKNAEAVRDGMAAGSGKKAGGFVPQVKRIPRAIVAEQTEQEASERPAEEVQEKEAEQTAAAATAGPEEKTQPPVSEPEVRTKPEATAKPVKQEADFIAEPRKSAAPDVKAAPVEEDLSLTVKKEDQPKTTDRPATAAQPAAEPDAKTRC